MQSQSEAHVTWGRRIAAHTAIDISREESTPPPPRAFGGSLALQKP